MEADGLHTILEKFNHLVKLANRLEKAPRNFGTGEPLTGSEIHLIEIIGENNAALGVTDLAKRLGVTKGAVSQSLKKLGKKGFSTKRQDPENNSRSIVELTVKGMAAYYSHKHWHETMDGGFKDYFTGLSQEKIDFLIDFITRFEDFLKRAMR